MDHRALQCFIALADELHFGRAAKRANIGQPGLSGQIARLERHIGFALFDRSSRSVALTNEGQRLLAPARQALAALDDLRAGARALAEARPPTLSVGCTSIAAFWGAHRLINAFADQMPNLMVETREMTSVEQEDAIAGGAIDVGFAHPPFANELDYVEIGREALWAALPRGSVLAMQDQLLLADIAAHPLILFPRDRGPHLFDRLMAAFAAQRLKPRLAKFANPFTVGIAAVASGRGIALVAQSYAGYRSDEVSYRPVADLDVSVPIALAWKQAAPGSWIDRFVKSIPAMISDQSHNVIDR